MKRKTLGLLLVASLVLSACGGKDGDVPTQPNTEATEVVTEVETDAETEVENHDDEIALPTLEFEEYPVGEATEWFEDYQPLLVEENTVKMGDIRLNIAGDMTTNCDSMGRDGFRVYGDSTEDAWSIKFSPINYFIMGQHMDWTGHNLLLFFGQLSTGPDFDNLTSTNLDDMTNFTPEGATLTETDNAIVYAGYEAPQTQAYGQYIVRVLPKFNKDAEDDGATTKWYGFAVSINLCSNSGYSAGRPETFVSEEVYNSILAPVTEKYGVEFPSWQECHDIWENGSY